jgi:hypothetical protein
MINKHAIFKNLPGKHIGGRIYMHRTCIGSLPRELYDKLQELDELFFNNKWGKGYNIIKLDGFGDDISFIFSEEFDVSDEPRIDYAYIIRDKKLFRTIDYSKFRKEVIPVYHHKWMFVRPDYKGFDVEKSKQRSEWWEKHPVILDRMKNDRFFKCTIGSYRYWNDLLKEMNEYDSKNRS